MRRLRAPCLPSRISSINALSSALSQSEPAAPKLPCPERESSATIS